MKTHMTPDSGPVAVVTPTLTLSSTTHTDHNHIPSVGFLVSERLLNGKSINNATITIHTPGLFGRTSLSNEKCGQLLSYAYIVHALSKQKKFLNEAILVVPQHLTTRCFFTQFGNGNEAKYRFPWKKATIDEQFLSKEKLKLPESFIEALPSDSREVIEKYGCDNDTDMGNFHLYNFMPCLNCSSQDMFDDVDMIFETTDDDKSEDKEEFHTVDLSEFDSLGDSLMLEEIFCQDPKELWMHHLPSLKKMTRHLQPKVVKDPFESSSKIQSLLQNDKDWEREEPCTQENKGGYIKHACMSDQHLMTEELFNLHQEETHCFLEECISAYSPSPKVDSKFFMAFSSIKTSLAIKEIDMSGNPEEENEQLDDKEVCLEKLDIEQDYTRTPCCQSFIGMNESSEGFKEETARATIDTPLLEINSSQTKVDLILPDLKLQPLPLPKVEEKFVTLKEEKAILQRILASEHFFDEVLADRLPVPDIDITISNSFSTPLILKELCEEMDIGKQELALNWSLKPHNENLEEIGLEKMDCSGGNLKAIEKNAFEFQENVAKYGEIDLQGYEDALYSDLMAVSNPKKFKREDTQFMKKIAKETQPKQKGTTGQKEATRGKFGFDPINDFLMMRTNSTLPCAEISSDARCEDINKNCMEENEDFSVPSLRKHRKKSKIKVLPLRMTEKYEQLLGLIENHARLFMPVLQQNGELSSMSFKSLTPDHTRFLLAQKEEQKPIQDMESYKAVVAVDILCNASDILIHCCLESALTYLSQTEEQYKDYLGGCLQEVHQKLISTKLQFQQQQIHHPKIIAICREVEKRLKKYCLTPDMKCELKVLIILKRNLNSLIEHIIEVLSTGSIVKVQYLKDGNCERLINSLDNYNCLMILGCNIGDDFPWAQFSLVIEYEKMQQGFCDLCSRQNIRYITFESGADELTSCKQNKYSLNPVTVIGSQTLLSKTLLLQILETRYNMMILERDFSLLNNKVPCADLIIDESSCIILHSLADLSDNMAVENLINKVAGISLKYNTCLLILNASDGRSERYHLGGTIVNTISRLNSAVCNFTSRNAFFQAKVVVCSTEQKVVEVIRKACDVRMETSPNWKSEDWGKRHWLSDVMSKKEMFLLAFPCLNSFNAQWMLQKFSIKQCLLMSFQELSESLPQIPKRCLQLFVEIKDSNSGLQLYVNTDTDSTDATNADFGDDEISKAIFDSDDINDRIDSHMRNLSYESAQTKEHIQQNINNTTSRYFGFEQYDSSLTNPEESHASFNNQITPRNVPYFRKGQNVKRNPQKQQNSNFTVQNHQFGNQNEETRDEFEKTQDLVTANDNFKNPAFMLTHKNMGLSHPSPNHSDIVFVNGQLASYQSMGGNSQRKHTEFMHQYQQPNTCTTGITVLSHQNQRQINDTFKHSERNTELLNLQQMDPVDQFVAWQQMRGEMSTEKQKVQHDRNQDIQRNSQTKSGRFYLQGRESNKDVIEGQQFQQYVGNRIFTAEPVQSKKEMTPIIDIEVQKRLSDNHGKVQRSLFHEEDTYTFGKEKNYQATWTNSEVNFNLQDAELQELNEDRHKSLYKDVNVITQQRETPKPISQREKQMLQCKRNLLSVGKSSYIPGYPSSVFTSNDMNDISVANTNTTSYEETREYDSSDVTHDPEQISHGNYCRNFSQQNLLKENHLCRGSFEDNLKETTRSILCRVTLPSDRAFFRPPPQRISIGLAQPLIRKDLDSTVKSSTPSHSDNTGNDQYVDTSTYNSKKKKDEISSLNNAPFSSQIKQTHKEKQSPVPMSNFKACNKEQPMFQNECQNRHLNMADSLWHSYDSPPMDLEPDSPDALYGNAFTFTSNEENNWLPRVNEYGSSYINNRSKRNFNENIMKSVKPKKKKLTYTYPPHCKSGQTKLVFT